MKCNSHRSPGRSAGRTSHSSPSLSKLEENAAIGDECSFTVATVQTHPQERPVTFEKTRQMTMGAGCIQETADEELSAHDSSSYSTLVVHMKRTPGVTSRKASKEKGSTLNLPVCMVESNVNGSILLELLRDSATQPPVTVATLQELDLSSIQNNLNLRVDICHDPELFFQPISGQKGVEKREESRRYWSALATEFRVYQHDAQAACSTCSNCSAAQSSTSLSFRPRLPIFLDTLRDIIQMLVPECDHEEVADHLDTDLLMQQVRMGAMDAVKLSSWLATLLTSHCAPMRDSTAIAVTEQLRNGTEQHDMDTFVSGLETLAGLLEGMKLDIANHQIRTFRYALIEGTVEFQRSCFSRAIEAGQIDVAESQRWYSRRCFDHRFDCGFQEQDEAAQKFACFVHGLVHLCNPDNDDIPATLHYDRHRLLRIQEDLQDHVQMNLCLSVFNHQVEAIAGSRYDPTHMHAELKQRIICLTEDEDGNGGPISDHLDAIAVEIARAAASTVPTSKTSIRSITSFDFHQTAKLLHDMFEHEKLRQSVTNDFLASLEDCTMHIAEQFRAMSTLEMSNAQRHWTQARTTEISVLADWDEMARKLAHIATVHWRVWGDLCYCDPSECHPSDEPDSASDNQHSDGSQSDTALDGNLLSSSSFSTSTIVPSSLHNCDSMGSDLSLMAFEGGTAAMSPIGAAVQRQDSGFAESVEAIDYTTKQGPGTIVEQRQLQLQRKQDLSSSKGCPTETETEEYHRRHHHQHH